MGLGDIRNIVAFPRKCSSIVSFELLSSFPYMTLLLLTRPADLHDRRGKRSSALRLSVCQLYLVHLNPSLNQIRNGLLKLDQLLWKIKKS